MKKKHALNEFTDQIAISEQRGEELRLLQQTQDAGLRELSAWADGEIIGTGVSDFTLDTALYPFEANQQKFALLDVPGIEGKESQVLAQIQRAVEKAHAVFYVTSKATAPQKGDEGNPGTLEKIKSHLNAQTEVWTLFNKRITNPMQLNRPALLSDDEQQSLSYLDDKMREQLGDNYCASFSLSAMPAFLSVAEHLVPGSDNAKKRTKILEQFTTDEVLKKTGVSEFLQLLTEKLVLNSQQKITRSNINKAAKTVDAAVDEIAQLQQGTYAAMTRQFQDQLADAHQLLDVAIAAFRIRLMNRSDSAVDKFQTTTRRRVYADIDNDISNDSLKDKLQHAITQQHGELEQALKALFEDELDKFKHEIEQIVERFKQYAEELLATYATMQTHKFNSHFELKIDIDSGLKVTGLLASLVGGALLWWNPAGWIVLAPALASLGIAAYKAFRSFFSSEYKMSQQRLSVDSNLNTITDNMKTAIREGVENAFPKLEVNIERLKEMLELPVRQVEHINQKLITATRELRQLSLQLTTSGAH